MSSPPTSDDYTVASPHKTPPHAPGTPAPPHRAAGSGNALPPGTKVDEFEVRGVLGEGGFGIVYLAWDHSLERQVALKEYMPSALAVRSHATQVQLQSESERDTFELGRRSFINEAKLLAQFDHPSLVKVYRFWEANGTAYMVMPYYEGITLKEHLSQLSGPPDESWLLDMLDALTDALSVIHAEDCFHRDIAPDNIILLAPSGRPLLLDFGAARQLIGDMTQALTLILKPGYAPVEQYAETSDMKQGAWTDIYALAASVHFAIVGKTPPAAVGRVLKDRYQPLAEVAASRYSARFLQAIDKALRVRAEDRTQSIAELRSDLGLGPAGQETQKSVLLTRANAEPAASAEEDPPREEPASLQPTAPPTETAVHDRSNPAPGSGRGSLGLAIAVIVLGASAIAAYFLLPLQTQVPVSAAPLPPTALHEPLLISPPAPAPSPVAVAPTVSRTPDALPRFDASEEFDKVLGAQSADFVVEAQAGQAKLRIGHDQLSFTLKSNRDGFVHVLVKGADGSLMLLFPNAESKANRIRAGQALRMPHESWALEATEPAGTEDFLVIVSEQPRDYTALSKVRDSIFLKLPTGEQATHLSQQWGRSHPMLLGVSHNCQGERCNAYGAARFKIDVVP